MNSLRSKEIYREIDPKSPFANCKLERERYANVLTDIVKNYSDGFVLALNNEWGAGKTTFVKMWEKQLNSNGIKTLYYNAWKNDFEKDVLVTLISELEELKEKKAEEIFKIVVKNAAPLAKAIGLGILKKQVEKLVDEGTIQEVLNLSADAIAEGLENQINAYTERKNSIGKFKESLTKYVKEVANGQPVVFIVDELDRCRPNFAVEVLEQIKHLFSVPGIVFVLSIDKTQLCHAVKGVYGSEGINADEYLRRFIDIEYSLPEPDVDKFCEYLYEYYEFDDFLRSRVRCGYPELQEDREKFIAFTKVLFANSKIPLRLQEKIYMQARLSLCLVGNNWYLLPELFVFLIFLKLKHEEIYRNIKTSSYKIQDLVKALESIFPTNIPDETLRKFLLVEAQLLVAYENSRGGREQEGLIIRRLGEEVGLPSVEEISTLNFKSKYEEECSNYLSNLLAKIEQSSKKEYELGITYLLKKIDLADMFKQSNLKASENKR